MTCSRVRAARAWTTPAVLAQIAVAGDKNMMDTTTMPSLGSCPGSRSILR